MTAERLHPYDVVTAFEQRVADYAGAKYGVAVNSCTNALMLSFVLRFMEREPWQRLVELPKYTYVGVPYAVLAAGGVCAFRDEDWEGAYICEPFDIIDSARRFHRGMYHGGLHCLSFHWYKHLPVGRGGMILTDSELDAEILRSMRFDGRTAGVAPRDDEFVLPGFHCYMIPEDAARGLMLMGNVKDYYEDLPWGPGTDSDYADLSEWPIFQVGWYGTVRD